METVSGSMCVAASCAIRVGTNVWVSASGRSTSCGIGSRSAACCEDVAEEEEVDLKIAGRSSIRSLQGPVDLRHICQSLSYFVFHLSLDLLWWSI